jgi:hypothetical protein
MRKWLFVVVALLVSGCMIASKTAPPPQVQKLKKELSISDLLTQESLKRLALYQTEKECRKDEEDELCRAFFFRETHQRVSGYNFMQPCVAGEYDWLEKRGSRTPRSSRELIFNAADRTTGLPESDRRLDDISWPGADPKRLLEANRTCKLFDPTRSGTSYADGGQNLTDDLDANPEHLCDAAEAIADIVAGSLHMFGSLLVPFIKTVNAMAPPSTEPGLCD